ncbi:MAG: AAA family ATPase [Pseudomonadota bacterium]
MLNSLDIKNFTVFADAKIEFSPGLNVLIGDNATGKSHLLKLGYSVMHSLRPTLVGFKPNSLGRLKRTGSGRQRTQITVELGDDTLQFSFANNSRREVTIDQSISQSNTVPPFFSHPRSAYPASRIHGTL